ncbi:MAG: hypothetical protein LBI59_10035 [Candidatus Accumulibacter sp.]|jgi:hypothetical protein|nr:hypothetical protein [Accumulibacter sp.]
MNAPSANPDAGPNPDSAGIAPAECACLLQNPALLQAVLEFNGFCAPPDPGARSGPLAGHLQALLAAQPRLWRFFPKPAQEGSVWCFEPAPNRLALLPPPLLERLGLYWSAAVWAEDLSRIIEKTRLHEVMGEIGPEVYRYAVRRGRFQLGGLRSSLRSGPERESPENAPARPAEWNAETFRRPGARILALCLAHWPQALRAAWEEHWRRPLPEENPDRPAAAFPALWLWVEKILCTEVAPEWQPCFSS